MKRTLVILEYIYHYYNVYLFRPSSLFYKGILVCCDLYLTNRSSNL